MLIACWTTLSGTVTASESEDGPRATHLRQGDRAPFDGDLLPDGQLQIVLEKYVHVRSERDICRADLEGLKYKQNGLEPIAEQRGAVQERYVQQKERVELEKQFLHHRAAGFLHQAPDHFR